MKRLMMACALAMTASAGLAETLDNAAVIAMVQAGLGEDVIAAKVRTSQPSYDLATDRLLELKKAGVPSAVITAMLNAAGEGAKPEDRMSVDSPDWRVAHPSGVYLLASWQAEPKMMRIDATTANQTKTGGIIGYALTGGIASLSMKSVIPNANARVRATIAKPEFYFFFDEANNRLSAVSTGSWLTGAAASVASPSEFSLVRFDVKSNRREARVGSFNMAGAKTGVMDKDRIPFTYDRVAPGVFRVVPAAAMPPGEYGFLYSLTAGSGPGIYGGGVMTARVFDFSIAP